MEKSIALFDVDGTLTRPRQVIEPAMAELLANLRLQIPVALVGGSDLCKIVEQMGGNEPAVLQSFDYLFAENGVIAYHGIDKIGNYSIHTHVGEEKLQDFINFCLGYLSKIRLPCKRGTFVEFRHGMLNISPIGRSCSQAERDQFATYDHEHKIRETFLAELRKNFPVSDYGLQFSIGGQISIDVFPVGWDKRFCLDYLIKDGFTKIYFFGDKTMPGGNDYEIFVDSRTIGHTVTSPADTRQQLQALFFSSHTHIE